MIALKRRKMLNWLSPEPTSRRHAVLQEKRVANTGDWFLHDDNFKSWKLGTLSRLLVCQGIGKALIEVR